MRDYARKAEQALLCILLLAVIATGATADITCDFESGLGNNAEPIADSIPGLVFSTTTGGDVYFADITPGWYNVTSDNGTVVGSGEYFVSGNVAAYVLSATDRARVDFTYGVASYFTVGYSSQFQFYAEAYDAGGSLLDTATGPISTLSNGDTGLQYLTVTSPGIAYVVLHDEGGYWLVDNITTDAPIAEPCSLVALIAGLGALASHKVRRRA